MQIYNTAPENKKEPILFPSRYPYPYPDQSGQGEGGGEAENICLFLNHYVLSESCLSDIELVAEAFKRMYGARVMDLVKVDRIIDLLRLHIYKTGIFSALDLLYIFGLCDGYVSRDFIYREVNRYKNLNRYVGPVNFTQGNYYIYAPDREPYCSYPIPPVIDYAGKTLSTRSVPHTYSIGLSETYIRLYSIHRPRYQTEFLYEIPLGNFQYTNPGKGKSGSEVAVDALGMVYDSEDKEADGTASHVLLLEQDMGTEPYRILTEKLRNYSFTDLYTNEASGKCSMVFSCHEILSIRKLLPLRSMPTMCDYIAVYFEICMLSSSVFGLSTNFDENDILPYLKGMQQVAELFVKEPLDEMRAGMLYDYHARNKDFIHRHGREDTIAAVRKIPVQGAFAAEILFSCMGVLGADGSINADHLYVGDIEHFLPMMDNDDMVTRTMYNRELYRKAYLRRTGFSRAVLDNIYHRRRGRYAQEDMTSFYAPMYKGYPIYTCATTLLTNNMPYILWDQESGEISYIYRILQECFEGIGAYYRLTKELDLSNGTLNHNKDYADGFPYTLRLRNCYEANEDGKRYAVCVEDYSMDMASSIRALLFARYYAGDMPIKLILLVDSYQQAFDFFRNELVDENGALIEQSPRCVVRIFDQDVNILDRGFSYSADNNLYWSDGEIDYEKSEIMFLKKISGLRSQERIFKIDPDGTVKFL